MLFCIKVKPMHKEAESFSLMILLLLFPYYITCFLKFCLALNSYLYSRHNLNQ